MRDELRNTNNFDLLRLLLASAVVLSHCVSCSGKPALAWLRYITGPPAFGGPGNVAVEGFFALSGYLVVASYERSSAGGYVAKRARRILPAYWAALVFSLLLGACLSSLPWGSFFRSADTWKFAAANISFLNFLHPSLPGLFTGNPKDNFVNDPLWTIKVEVMFYVSVPLLVAACRRFGTWQTLAALFFASLAFRIEVRHLHMPRVAHQLPGVLSYFLIGTFAWYYRQWFHANRLLVWLAAGISASGVMLVKWSPLHAMLQTIAVPLIVICFAVLLPHIVSLTRLGDLSYGTYVLHYPVIQSLVALGLFNTHPGLAVVTVVVTVGVLAFASWHLVEVPFLDRPARSASMLANHPEFTVTR